MRWESSYLSIASILKPYLRMSIYSIAHEIVKQPLGALNSKPRSIMASIRSITHHSDTTGLVCYYSLSFAFSSLQTYEY